MNEVEPVKHQSLDTQAVVETTSEKQLSDYQCFKLMTVECY